MESFFVSNIFIKPWNENVNENVNENGQPWMAGECSLGKFLCLQKQWRILVFTTKMIFYKNKSEDTTWKVRFGGISLQPPCLATQKLMVSFVIVTIFVWNVVQPDV